MTVDKAIKTFLNLYERVEKAPGIEDPVAFALFHTWKQADKDRQDKKEKR
jgi:hypothetical protein